MKNQPWIGAINLLLKAQLRPNPRPKPGAPVTEKYWNGQDLAAVASIRPNTLSDILRGKRDPSMETIVAISKALGVSPATLLMNEEEVAAYADFQQSRAATAESVAREAALDRLLERKADEMKAGWIAQMKPRLLADLQSQEAPPAEPVIQHRQQRKRVR